MKFNFRKIASTLASTAMVGSTVALAAAASFPAPFVDNGAADVTVVYGSTLDMTAVGDITTALSAALSASDGSTTTLEGATGITEDEVPLGGVLNVSGSKIITTLTDSKIESLLDKKLNWDDGGASGADDYNIHEEILVGSMAIHTTFNDNDFAELLAMTNDKQFEYRYVFDDEFNVSGVGNADAEDLFLDILGISYEVKGMTATSLTVVTSEDFDGVGVGDSVTVEGETFTVQDMSSTNARVNGETLTPGTPKTINGLKVEIESGSIFYNENFPDQASLTLRVGNDISKTFSDGEEYVGEDEDDPTWIWHLGTGLGGAGDYIGVQYNQKETRDTDDVVYEGGSYMLPENFGEVRFDGTTAGITYEDYMIYFDDSEDLWNNTDLTSTAQTSDAPVLIIESVSGVEDAIKLTTSSQETDKMYLRWANSTQETQGTQANATLEVFYSDVDGTVSDAIRPRFSVAYSSTTNETSSSATIAASDLGDLVYGDTTIAMSASVVAGNLQIIFTDGGAGQTFTVDAGGVALNHSEGSLKWFGGDTETTDKEDGLAGDMLVASTNVGTYDNDIMTTNGQIIRSPESNLDNDQVIFSVPSDRVYATVSVVAGGTASTDGASTLGSVSILDSDLAASGMSGNNLIVVGGSCVNSVAADLLTVSAGTCGSGWSAATGLGEGDYVVQTFAQSDGKVATLVAGWSQEDTASAATFLANGADVSTAADSRYVNGAPKSA